MASTSTKTGATESILTPTTTLKCHGGRVRSISYCPDGQRMISGSSDKTARQWDVETGTVRAFEGHSRRINCVDISVDNTLLASGADDFTARMWNLNTGKLVAGPFKSISMVGAVRFSTDSKKLALKSDVGKCVEVWDIES
ncbi:hypothetical protein CY34DRAFT_103143, partial [Suillus luteus UH-Slu-Lm8-n1]